MKSFFSAAEVGKLLNVDRATITRWIQKGLIENVFRPEGSKEWKIPVASYEKLLKKHENS